MLGGAGGGEDEANGARRSCGRAADLILVFQERHRGGIGRAAAHASRASGASGRLCRNGRGEAGEASHWREAAARQLPGDGGEGVSNGFSSRRGSWRDVSLRFRSF